jgi:mannose-6-phosphate isomerase-like protein (cupin superfamily)
MLAATRGEDSMQQFSGATFTADTAWSGPLVSEIGDVQVKLRWTDRPFRWHRNDGREVFAVLDGRVDMHMRDDAGERVASLGPGDILAIEAGQEHVAHPRGPARVLVVEAREAEGPPRLEDAVNGTCPWSGRPVSADSLTRYRGRVVGFCNPGCRDRFEAATRMFDAAI